MMLETRILSSKSKKFIFLFPIISTKQNMAQVSRPFYGLLWAEINIILVRKRVADESEYNYALATLLLDHSRYRGSIRPKHEDVTSVTVTQILFLSSPQVYTNKLGEKEKELVTALLSTKTVTTAGDPEYLRA